MMHTSPASYRGVSMVRADASDPNKILEQLNRAFAEFKGANDERLCALERGQSDVVRNEKVDRINAAVGDLQAALDEANQRIANLSAGGLGGDRGRVRDGEYSKAWAQHFRRGDVQASLTKGVATDGGYFAPVEWDRTITERLKQVSPMRQICRVQPISGAGFSKAFGNHGTTSGWVGETAARPETASPTNGSLNYKPGEIYANVAATQALLDDSELDIETYLADEVQLEFAKQEGDAFISGTGANDRPNGLLTYVTGGANAAAHPWGAIQTVASGAVADLTTDALINLVYNFPSEFAARANFIMSRATTGTVRLKKDTTNNYLWQPSNQAGQPATLLGFPIVEMPGMPAIATGAKSIVLGDFLGGYIIVDRMGTRVLRDPFSNKPYVMFYATKRVGGGLLDPDRFRALNIG